MPLALLSQTLLFQDIDPAQIPALLAVLQPVRRSCGKGEILVVHGQPCTSLGIVLSGQIEAWRILPDSTSSHTSRMGPGGMFGEILCGAAIPSPVTVQMTVPGEVLLFSYSRFFDPALQSCPAAGQLTQNLLQSVSRKYFALVDRVEILTLKSLRGKICTYLLHCADSAGADTFSVPHSRAELAAYLGCDRSALSRELSHMQTEGYLETYKNSFKILDRSRMERLGLA